jgi:hypothetical protein
MAVSDRITESKVSKNTKIYTVFGSSGYGGAGKALKSLTTNEDLLHKLQNECSGIDFGGKYSFLVCH